MSYEHVTITLNNIEVEVDLEDIISGADDLPGVLANIDDDVITEYAIDNISGLEETVIDSMDSSDIVNQKDVSDLVGYMDSDEVLGCLDADEIAAYLVNYTGYHVITPGPSMAASVIADPASRAALAAALVDCPQGLGEFMADLGKALVDRVGVEENTNGAVPEPVLAGVEARNELTQVMSDVLGIEGA